MPFNALAGPRPARRAYRLQQPNMWLALASGSDVLPRSVRVHPWTLGFRESTFHLIAPALQGGIRHVFCYPLLYRHAVVPSPFRV